MATANSNLLLPLVIILLITSLNGIVAAECEYKEITIDDMKSLNDWRAIKDDKHNCSIDLTTISNGLKISYNLEENESWVDIYNSNLDFRKIPEINKLSFQFTGNGAPNTLELKLVYEDSSTFGYEYNRATNSTGTVSLYPWQIKYWWGGKGHLNTETVDFSKVKEIRFAISNNPDKKDVLGEGFVVISKVVGQTEPGIWEKYKDLIIAIISAFAGIMAGYFVGRKRS